MAIEKAEAIAKAPWCYASEDITKAIEFLLGVIKGQGQKTPVPEAGVYTARGLDDLNQLVYSLAQQGFRIITVIDTQNGDYHAVAQIDR